MNKLDYALTLIKSLANDANEDQQENDALFYTNLFRLYVNGRMPSPIPTNTMRLRTVQNSVELLLKYTAAENVKGLIKGFMRDTRPEHMPAYDFLFSSISPNKLDEETIGRLTIQIRTFCEQVNYEKLEILLRFLIGYHGPMMRGTRDPELLYNAVRRVARFADQNTNFSMCRMLAIRKRRELQTPVGNQPTIRDFYNRIIPLIQTLIDRFPDLGGEDFIAPLLEPVN